MDTLRERLAEAAHSAPAEVAPAAELWARGKRAQRLRAAAVAATVLVVGAVGTGVGVRLAEGDDRGDGSDIEPARTVDVSLPIEYPVGQELPDLGNAPGQLAAVWLAPREPYTTDDDNAGRAPQAVGLVAKTGMFGKLPIDLYAWTYESPDSHFALSPDGRRIAYYSPPERRESEGETTSGDLVVLDLVSGEEYSPPLEFDVRSGASWVDPTHLLGHVAGGSDADGWVWDAAEPDTAASLVDPYSYTEGFPPADSPVFIYPTGYDCQSPRISDSNNRPRASVLCDVVGVVNSEILLGHLYPGASPDPTELNQAVVAVDARDDADFPFDDPALRRMVVTPGAPYPVAFATDLLAEALEVDGGAS